MAGALDTNVVRVFLLGNRERAKDFIGEANKLLFQLKNIQSLGNSNRVLKHQYPDGTRIKVLTDLGGVDNVYIEAPPPKLGDWELYEEIRIESLVAIIDCENGRVCFDITEKEGTAGWGGMCDFMKAEDIKYNTKDPVAPRTGQDTWRTQWYDKTTLSLVEGGGVKEETITRILQCQRVDGGHKAYEGDPLEWEEGGLYSTLIDNSENIWDDERPSYCPAILSNITIDPGPPTGADLEVFEDLYPGYEWDWCGYNDGPFSEFYGLFLVADVGVKTSWWYPREFNQYVNFQYDFQILNCTHIATYEHDSRGWPETHHFTETESAAAEYYSKRGWQCWPVETGSFTAVTDEYPLYLNYYSTKDIGAEAYPYTTPTPVPYQDEYAEYYMGIPDAGYGGNNGVYVDHELEYFIFLGAEYAPFGWDNRGWMFEERLPCNIDLRFNSPGDLTAREVELLAGNWFARSDWKDPGYWGGLVYPPETGESWTDFYSFMVGIYCEGKFYPEFEATPDSSDNYWGNAIDHRTWYENNHYTPDLGIFTTGVYDEPGDTLKEKEIKYAYALRDTTGDGANQGRFGVLLGKTKGDRTHVYSEWYPESNNYYLTIPEVTKAIGGRAIYSITVGVKTIVIKRWKRGEV